MRSGRGRSLTWDGENRPASITVAAPQAILSFAYGPDGARISKTAHFNINCLGGAVGTLRIDTLTLGPEIERVDKWNCVGGGIVFSTRTWTLHPHGDAKIVRAEGAPVQSAFLHRDHLSTVRLETDAAGAVAQRSRYQPYGERTPSTSQQESKGYIGERHDPETGLIYLNARYYDPAIGRSSPPTPSTPTSPAWAPTATPMPTTTPSTRPTPTATCSRSCWRR